MNGADEMIYTMTIGKDRVFSLFFGNEQKKIILRAQQTNKLTEIFGLPIFLSMKEVFIHTSFWCE